MKKRKPRKPMGMDLTQGYIDISTGNNLFWSLGPCECGESYMDLKETKRLHKWLSQFIAWAESK